MSDAKTLGAKPSETFRRFKYEYTHREDNGLPYHAWSVASEKLGLHFWATQSTDLSWFGGVEVHYYSPPGYMKDQPPSNDPCWLLNAPCWHDGSSLQAEERWIPFWLEEPNNHDRMFRRLDRHLDEREAGLAAEEES